MSFLDGNAVTANTDIPTCDNKVHCTFTLTVYKGKANVIATITKSALIRICDSQVASAVICIKVPI